MSEWKQLRELREQANLTREQLSEASGLSATQIYRLESGRSDYEVASFSTIKSLAKGLGVSLTDLIGEHDPIDLFFDRLEKSDQIKIVGLSHEAGKSMGEARPGSYMYFYSLVPPGVLNGDVEDPVVKAKTDVWFGVACLAAYIIQRADKEAEAIPLASALGKVARREGDHLERLVSNALESSWDTDGNTIRLVNGLVRTATQHGYKVDYRALLRDAIHWNDNNQEITDKWVKEFVEA